MLRAAQSEQRRHPLFRPGRGVAQPIARPQRPREHLEHRDLADERVGDGAEDVHDGLAVGVRCDAHLGAAVALRGAADDDPAVVIARGGRQGAQQIGDAVDPGAGQTRAEQDRHRLARRDLVREGALELVGGGLVALEIRLELGVVVRDDLLGHAHVEVVLLRLRRGRERLLVVVPGVVVDERVLAEDVGDGVEVLLLAERQLEGPQVVAERRAQLGEDAAEVRARAVLLRDDHDARHARLLAPPPTPRASRR